jgi:hypothetical protein
LTHSHRTVYRSQDRDATAAAGPVGVVPSPLRQSTLTSLIGPIGDKARQMSTLPSAPVVAHVSSPDNCRSRGRGRAGGKGQARGRAGGSGKGRGRNGTAP